MNCLPMSSYISVINFLKWSDLSAYCVWYGLYGCMRKRILLHNRASALDQSTLCYHPQLSTEFGKRSFSSLDPAVWNGLYRFIYHFISFDMSKASPPGPPAALRNYSISLQRFKRHLNNVWVGRRRIVTVIFCAPCINTLTLTYLLTYRSLNIRHSLLMLSDAVRKLPFSHNSSILHHYYPVYPTAEASNSVWPLSVTTRLTNSYIILVL